MKLRMSRACLLAATLFACGPIATAEDTPAHPAGEVAAGTHAPGEHQQSSVFAGGIGNAVITLVIFGIVLYVLGTKAWPPLVQMLAEREHHIRGALENAKREREEAEKLLAEYKRQIDRAREEATAIVEEGRRDAGEVRRRIQDEARREADEMIARAKREIQLASDAVIKDLYDRTADLTVQLASTVIEKSLSTEDHRKLVADSLNRITSASDASRN